MNNETEIKCQVLNTHRATANLRMTVVGVTCKNCQNTIELKSFPSAKERKCIDFNCPKCGDLLLNDLDIKLLSTLGEL